jgi:hypothetical protein
MCVKYNKRACKIKTRTPAPPDDLIINCVQYLMQYNHKNESVLSKQEKWILLHGLHVAYKKFGIRSLRNNQNTFVGYFKVLIAINKRLWFCDAMGSDRQVPIFQTIKHPFLEVCHFKIPHFMF